MEEDKDEEKDEEKRKNFKRNQLLSALRLAINVSGKIFLNLQKKRKNYHSVQPWDQTFIYFVEEFIIIFNFKLYLQLSKKRDKELGLPSKVAKIKGSCENGRKSQKSGFRQSIDQILREQKYLLCRDLPSTLLKFTFTEERGTES